MILPKIKKLGPNFTQVTVDDKVLFFSYEELIAFVGPTGTIIRKNVWGEDMGDNLDAIDPDKTNRVNGVNFETAYGLLFGDTLQT